MTLPRSACRDLALVTFLSPETMDVTKLHKSIRFRAMDGVSAYKFIGLGAVDVAKPYEIVGLAAVGRRSGIEACRPFRDVPGWHPGSLG